MRKHIKTESQAARVKALAAIVQNIGRDFNLTLTETKTVRPEFMAHWIDINTGKHGIENLIYKVLCAAKAHSPATAKTAAFIRANINAEFTDATPRYPQSTISQYLCNSGGKFCKRYSFVAVPTGSNPHLAYYVAKEQA